ncbi:MAG: hypothetical protein ACTSRC_08310 [Candidatus Helarchaeota archaeon]
MTTSSIVEKNPRRNYYFISLIFGMIYFLMHFFLRTLLATNFIPDLDFSFLILDGLFVVTFYIKDTLDEINLQRGGNPVGPSWIEHIPFIGMVALHAAVIAITDPLSPYATLEWIFAALLLVDIIWDITQDLRATPDR